uniref:B-cell CLL/lymphoma 7 protein family member A n=1 Tax=Suricata suricatta TaxID=37032 RepID=A0A673V552_SURSU
GRSCGWLPPSTGPSQRGDFRQAPGSLFLAGRVGRLLAGVPSGVLRVGTCPLPWVSVQWGCRRGGGGAWGGRARTPASLSSRGISACGSVPPDADDNSNQSSIADASPIKQENSSNSSPAPEPASAAPGEGTDAKADETQADGKELPGAEARRGKEAGETDPRTEAETPPIPHQRDSACGAWAWSWAW